MFYSKTEEGTLVNFDFYINVIFDLNHTTCSLHYNGVNHCWTYYGCFDIYYKVETVEVNLFESYILFSRGNKD